MNKILICKFCGSDNVIMKKQAGYIVMLSFLLLGLPLTFFKRTFYCFDCGKEWKINNNGL